MNGDRELDLININQDNYVFETLNKAFLTLSPNVVKFRIYSYLLINLYDKLELFFRKSI